MLPLLPSVKLFKAQFFVPFFNFLCRISVNILFGKISPVSRLHIKKILSNELLNHLIFRPFLLRARAKLDWKGTKPRKHEHGRTGGQSESKKQISLKTVVDTLRPSSASLNFASWIINALTVGIGSIIFWLIL